MKEAARGKLQATKAPSGCLAHGLGSVRFRGSRSTWELSK